MRDRAPGNDASREHLKKHDARDDVEKAIMKWGRFRLGFLAAIVVYNWTEAAFKTISPIWFMFYFIAMDYPKPEYEPVVESGAVSEEDAELAYPPRETIQA